MKLKEIKPGMVIHWKTDDEKDTLLEELDRLGYVWHGCKRKPTERKREIGHVIHVSEDGGWKNITHSGLIQDITHEFSDLVLPELTTEEVLQIFGEICSVSDCSEEGCPLFNISGRCTCPDNIGNNYKEVIEICTQWKANHEKEEPEVEWHFHAEVHGNGFDLVKNCDTEKEAIRFVEEELKKAGKDAYGEYKRTCIVN